MKCEVGKFVVDDLVIFVLVYELFVMPRFHSGYSTCTPKMLYFHAR